eukprot:superscaffoldBa00002458_g14305
MMGLSKGSSKALCFAIDTTGSMSDDIAAVRNVTSSIINSKVGTEDEPSVYILVPFNDPDFGPLMRTTDPQLFKNAINSLTATGGGDLEEMSLSGLQLALTGSPPNSEIFVFTDAPAKDTHLRSTVLALIEQKKTVVNFMITSILSRRRRQIDNDQQQKLTRMVASDVQLYRDLAQASGGQAIEVTKSELPEVTSIITESSSSSLVTLLQAARNPGKAENFTFTVDETIRNLTIYITGTAVTFTLVSPSGQSGIDFLFDFLEVSQGPFGGFDVIDNRPRAGVNGSLMVTVTGSDSATVTEVTLVESLGSGEVNGSVEAQGGRDFLVHFDRIPSQEFVVLIKGQNSNGSSKASSVLFQRQSPTSIRASTLTVTADDSNNVLVPGTPLSVPFSVMTSGAGGTFNIQANNDQGFASSFPSSLILETGGSANSTVNLTAPLNTASGTDVTLTIEAEAPGGTDTNYIVLRFTVLETVTDFTQPVCQLLSLQSNCSNNCSSSMWELSVQVTDGAEGTGVDRVSLRQGNGALNTSLAAGSENGTLVSYRASCCSPDVELLVVDRVVRGMMSGGLAVLCLLLLHTGVQGFGLLPGNSLNHLEITERAILNATVQVCRALAQAEGTDFTFPAQPFTVKGVAVACGAQQSSKSFHKAITFIILRNVRVDIRHALNASFHFDEEMFVQGRKIITEGIQAVKASNKQENFEAARQKLGEILHPLQDFYSHSNWVELGNKFPNTNLIRSDTSIGNIADESRATCRNCVGDDCRNNILEDIIQDKILTSGYFSIVPLFATKPKEA